MIARTVIVIALLLGAGMYTARAGSAEATVAREPLTSLTNRLGEWTGRESAPFPDDVLAQLGVDDYVNRHYVRSGSAMPIGMYVGYYESQRQGDTIHSPQNCLPGAGWRPVASGHHTIVAGGRELVVNRYVIQKGLDRQVVLYWYQGRGRVVANEYANKALLMLDAARLHRTNGGLVRLIAPVTTTAEAATDELSAFATSLFPLLEKHLP
jgi:EpsI family protein